MWWMNRSPSESAEAMLDKASDNSKAMKSFQYTLTGTQTHDSGATESSTLFGQMELPDKTYGRDTDVDGTVLSETIQIGGNFYSRSGRAGLWLCRSRDGNPFAGTPTSVSASGLVDGVLMFLENLELIGEGRENGVVVAHIRGTTNMEKKAELYWPTWDSMPADKRESLADVRLQSLKSTETVDVWVDRDNRFLIRTRTIAVVPSVGEEEGFTAEGTMEFSGYNEVAITAPSENECLPAP